MWDLVCVVYVCGVSGWCVCVCDDDDDKIYSKIISKNVQLVVKQLL